VDPTQELHKLINLRFRSDENFVAKNYFISVIETMLNADADVPFIHGQLANEWAIKLNN
jgi:hypothetical protein